MRTSLAFDYIVRKIPLVLVIFLGTLMMSCKTYTIPMESFKVQMGNARYERSNDTTRTYLDSLSNYWNGIDYLFVVDKNGDKLFMKSTPDLQIRIIQSNGDRDTFYFDTIFIVGDTLEGRKSRFFTNARKKIPMDSIKKIELQKKNTYDNQDY